MGLSHRTFRLGTRAPSISYAPKRAHAPCRQGGDVPAFDVIAVEEDDSLVSYVRAKGRGKIDIARGMADKVLVTS